MARNKLVAELHLEISRFRRSLKQAQAATRAGFGNMGKTGGNTMGRAMANGLASTSRVITGTLVGITTAAAAVAGFQAGKIIGESMRKAGETEKLQMRFNIITGSSSKGADLMKEIRSEAIRTGIELNSLAGNVTKFMAFGFDTSEALKLNKGMLDVAGSIGLTSMEVRLLGVALSQVAAKGVANMEELRQQIAEKGIPILEALQETLNLETQGDLFKAVSKGEVSSKAVLDIFKGVTDGEGPFAKFSGGADRMASTFLGIIEVIKRKWDEFRLLMGEPIINAVKPFLKIISEDMDRLIENAVDLGNRIAGVVTQIVAVFKQLRGMSFSEITETLKAALIVAATAFGNKMWQVMNGILAASASIMGSMLQGIGDALSSSGMSELIQGLGNQLSSSILSSLAGSLHDMLSKMGDTGKKVLGFIGLDEDMVKSLEGEAAGARMVAKGKITGGTDLMAQEFEGSVQGAAVAAGKAFVNAVKEGGDMFFSPESEKRVRDVIDKAKASVFGPGAANNITESEYMKIHGRGFTKPQEEGQEKKRAASVMASGNSRLAQALNVIQGRSGFAVMAQQGETAKGQRDDQIKEQKTTNDKLDKVIAKLSPNPGSGATTFA